MVGFGGGGPSGGGLGGGGGGGQSSGDLLLVSERGVEVVSRDVFAQPDPLEPVELRIELFRPILPVSSRGAEPGVPGLADAARLASRGLAAWFLVSFASVGVLWLRNFLLTLSEEALNFLRLAAGAGAGGMGVVGSVFVGSEMVVAVVVVAAEESEESEDAMVLLLIGWRVCIVCFLVFLVFLVLLFF